MNTILKICRVGPLLGLITRWHLYRVSRHVDAASRSVLPRERFRSLPPCGHADRVPSSQSRRGAASIAIGRYGILMTGSNAVAETRC